uniref:hypothetical protein n=1 Tax=Candidatus Limisoma sp. TaxID=3076476 RepID=UPI0040258843
PQKKQSKFQFLPLFSIKIQTPDYQSQTNRISSVGAFSFPQLARFRFLSWQKRQPRQTVLVNL